MCFLIPMSSNRQSVFYTSKENLKCRSNTNPSFYIFVRTSVRSFVCLMKRKTFLINFCFRLFSDLNLTALRMRTKTRDKLSESDFDTKEEKNIESLKILFFKWINIRLFKMMAVPDMCDCAKHLIWRNFWISKKSLVNPMICLEMCKSFDKKSEWKKSGKNGFPKNSSRFYSNRNSIYSGSKFR